MAAEHWFRWHHGTVTDPKWRIVAKRASHAMSRNVTVGNVVSIWAAMLENASQGSPRGSLENWSDEDIGIALDIDEREVASIRQCMQGKTLDDVVLIAWNRRQIKREDETAADRKAAQRLREKSQSENVTDSNNGKCHTPSHDVTVETETETERSKALEQQAARKTASRFAEFWAAYPVKKGKTEAEAKWRAKHYDRIADRIIDDVKRRTSEDRQWIDGYAPHGSTYVNARGWEDDIEPVKGSTNSSMAFAGAV